MEMSPDKFKLLNDFTQTFLTGNYELVHINGVDFNPSTNLYEFGRDIDIYCRENNLLKLVEEIEDYFSRHGHCVAIQLSPYGLCQIYTISSNFDYGILIDVLYDPKVFRAKLYKPNMNLITNSYDPRVCSGLIEYPYLTVFKTIVRPLLCGDLIKFRRNIEIVSIKYGTYFPDYIAYYNKMLGLNLWSLRKMSDLRLHLARYIAFLKILKFEMICHSIIDALLTFLGNVTLVYKLNCFRYKEAPNDILSDGIRNNLLEKFMDIRVNNGYFNQPCKKLFFEIPISAIKITILAEGFNNEDIREFIKKLYEQINFRNKYKLRLLKFK